MLEVGWSEILVIAIILIVVVGPKDLPQMMRTFGKMMGRVRTMANEFRSQFDEAMREAELDDVRKGISEVNKYNPASSLRDAMNPIRKLGEDIKSDLQKAGDVSSPAKADTGTSVDELLSDPLVDPEPANPEVSPAAAAPTKPVMGATPVVQPVAAAVAAPLASEPVKGSKPEARKPAAKKKVAAAIDDYPPPARKVVKRKPAETHVEHEVRVVANEDKPASSRPRKAPAAVKAEPVEAKAAKPRPAPKKKTTRTGDA